MSVRVAPLQESERVFLLRSLETGQRAILVTRPITLSLRDRWSWALRCVVRQKHPRRRSTVPPNRF